ncbi:hypothetical protein L0152_23015 [bacterium]|nr:hypothetical protein [bacterium]
MDEKIALAIALFRFQIIAPALDKNLVEQKNYFAIQAEKVWDVPHYGTRKYTPAAFKYWLSDYRKGGLEALKPARRSDTGQPRKIGQDLAQRISAIAAEMEEATVSYLYRQLSLQKIINPPWLSESALRRFIKAKDLLSTKSQPLPRKKFEKEHVNELWIADFMVRTSPRAIANGQQSFATVSMITPGSLWEPGGHSQKTLSHSN